MNTKAPDYIWNPAPRGIRKSPLWLASLALGVVCVSKPISKAASESETKVWVAAANQWKNGEPIPATLLDYNPSWRDGSCFPWPDGTEVLFEGITNYAFFTAVLERPSTDPGILTNAVEKALRLAGPTRFFTDALETLRRRPELALKAQGMAWIQAQAAVKHIVVDSMYISYARMDKESAAKTLKQIRRDLLDGTNWDCALRSWSAKLEYKEDEPLLDGGKVTLTLSQIGNLGNFILPKNEDPLFSFREDLMPREHKPKLLVAQPRDILILFDKEDLSPYPTLVSKETGERLVLHRIRELWKGSAK